MAVADNLNLLLRILCVFFLIISGFYCVMYDEKHAHEDKRKIRFFFIATIMCAVAYALIPTSEQIINMITE